MFSFSNVIVTQVEHCQSKWVNRVSEIVVVANFCVCVMLRYIFDGYKYVQLQMQTNVMLQNGVLFTKKVNTDEKLENLLVFLTWCNKSDVMFSVRNPFFFATRDLLHTRETLWSLVLVWTFKLLDKHVMSVREIFIWKAKVMREVWISTKLQFDQFSLWTRV